MHTVEIDPERAPLVEWAFESYASGDWTPSQLHKELTARRLTNPCHLTARQTRRCIGR